MLNAGMINWLAVIVAVAAHQALGFLWYGSLFGKMWLEGMGKKHEELGSPGPALAVSVIMTVVMAVALALLLTVPRALT